MTVCILLLGARGGETKVSKQTQSHKQTQKLGSGMFADLKAFGTTWSQMFNTILNTQIVADNGCVK